MQKMTNWEELEWRGLVKDVAGADIQEKINNESVTFYWGTDPTADSLHLGHYSSLVTAKRLMKMGHSLSFYVAVLLVVLAIQDQLVKEKSLVLKL